MDLDAAARTVTIEGGMNYGQLCPLLDEKGYALHNLASLPHISVAGAAATATHGSGVANGNLATAVKALEVVTAEGELITFSANSHREEFDAVVVGARCDRRGHEGDADHPADVPGPAACLREAPFAQATEHFDEIMGAGYSVSLFTDWQSDSVNEVWVKRRADDPRSSRR